MPSLVPGFEYDIFISYRQKDNKYDGWVTDFVDNLIKELEATFKEDISVYFDINSHDGLLETHDVNESLKEKLKCLIFIPILSRTYCDCKSFAWEHEFKAFVELSSLDQFGLKIRLPSGNVANRILPIQIHDLHPEDKSLLEKELGGALRAIEFIYKEPGVNRPLRETDKEEKNSSKTNYRNQINKVANAIDEVIHSLNQVQTVPQKRKSHYDQYLTDIKEESIIKFRSGKALIGKKLKLWLMVLLAAVIFITGGFIFTRIAWANKKSQSLPDVEKTIAVLPFRNLSYDSLQVALSDGFMEDLLNNLQKVKSLTVRPRTSSFQYKDTKKSTALIRRELNVNYLVGGSIGPEGKSFKIRVYLIDANADKQIWSNDYTRGLDQLPSLQSEIATGIASELKAVLSTDEIEMIGRKSTENPEAYKYYLQGEYFFWKNVNSGETKGAIELYEKAIEIDPGFALAYTGIAKCLLDQYWYFKDHSEGILRKSKIAIDKALKIDPDLTDARLALGIYYYHGYLKYQEALNQFEFILKKEPGNVNVLEWIAAVYRRSGNWKMAQKYFEKASELNPGSASLAQELAETADMLRDYPAAEHYYNKSILLQPDLVFTYYELSNMVLRWKGDTKRSREILSDALLNNKSSISDSMIIEMNFWLNICDQNYQGALNDVALLKYDIIHTHWYCKPKYLYYADIYGLMHQHDLEHAYYDSARYVLERKMNSMNNDPAFYSSLGIAYAGLGLKDKAIEAGKKGTDLMPINKEALRGITRAEDLALIYVMVGEYDEAIRQIKMLLSIPGFLTVKILELDPRWAPLKNKQEFRKLIADYSLKM